MVISTEIPSSLSTSTAPCMIGASLCEPTKIITCSGVIVVPGCRRTPSLSLRHRLGTNVPAVVHTVAADLINCAVRACDGVAIIRASAHHGENAAPGGHNPGAARGRAGMKIEHVRRSVGSIQPADRFAGLIDIRVTARCE